jgi:hypothetical protein
VSERSNPDFYSLFRPKSLRCPVHILGFNPEDCSIAAFTGRYCVNSRNVDFLLRQRLKQVMSSSSPFFTITFDYCFSSSLWHPIFLFFVSGRVINCRIEYELASHMLSALCNFQLFSNLFSDPLPHQRLVRNSLFRGHLLDRDEIKRVDLNGYILQLASLCLLIL